MYYFIPIRETGILIVHFLNIPNKTLLYDRAPLKTIDNPHIPQYCFLHFTIPGAVLSISFE